MTNFDSVLWIDSNLSSESNRIESWITHLSPTAQRCGPVAHARLRPIKWASLGLANSLKCHPLRCHYRITLWQGDAITLWYISRVYTHTHTHKHTSIQWPVIPEKSECSLNFIILCCRPTLHCCVAVVRLLAGLLCTHCSMWNCYSFLWPFELIEIIDIMRIRFIEYRTGTSRPNKV